jgi:hypothetical protein
MIVMKQISKRNVQLSVPNTKLRCELYTAYKYSLIGFLIFANKFPFSTRQTYFLKSRDFKLILKLI